MRMTCVPRIVAAAVLVVTAAACDRRAELPTGAPRQPQAGIAPLLPARDAIAGRYVVVLKPGAGSTAAESQQMAAAAGARVHRTFDHALHGFAATLTPQALEQLRRNPRVDYVAEDGWVQLDTTQSSATWGLDRIDQRNLPLNTTYTYGGNGQGVRVYVIDTGIRTTHSEFGGRASVGTDLVNDGQNGQDCNGHGTHVSGTIAGTTYGVAKAAQLIAVRVFACTGGAEYSTIIAAVDWVTANAVKPAVVNMSLGGGYYAPVNQALQNSIATGIVYVVAAGNESTDACTTSPASTPEAITVGATDWNDYRVYFSNWGSCVDIFAPGYSITSAWYGSDTQTNTISGTSMASPHVAGVAALVLQGQPTATPAEVAQKIVTTGTRNRLFDVGVGSPNNLLFNGMTAEPPVPMMSLTPGALAFSLVRTVAGTATLSPEAAGGVSFRASGAGSVRADAGTAPQGVTTTATSASSRVLLSNPGTGTLEWRAASDKTWLKATPTNGSVEPTYGTIVDASVNAGTMAPGTYNGALTFTAVGSSISPVQLPVTMTVINAVTLTPGTPRTGLAGSYGNDLYFTLQVPSNATTLTVSIAGGTGDADLYVRYGAPPTFNEFDCRPLYYGNNEACTATLPTPGTYYVMLRSFGSYADVTLNATVGGPPASPTGVASAVSTATSIRTTWVDGSWNETSFSVGRQVQNGSGVFGAWQTLGSPGANASAYLNGGLLAGSTYRYRVRACNASGCSAWAYGGNVTLPGVTIPNTVAAAALSSTSVRVTWVDASTNETQFSVQRRLLGTDGVTWGGWGSAASPPAGSTSLDNTGLLPGRIYQYRVRACNGTTCSNYATSNQVATIAG